MNYLANRILKLAFKKNLTESEKREMQHINEFLDGKPLTRPRMSRMVNVRKD